MKHLLVLLLCSITYLANADLKPDYILDFDDDIKKSDVIFIGKVDTIIYYNIWTTCGPKPITNFIVLKSFKGLYNNSNYISVSSNSFCLTDDNYTFKKDSTYLVFSTEIFDQILTTSNRYSNSLVSKVDSIDIKN